MRFSHPKHGGIAAGPAPQCRPALFLWYPGHWRGPYACPGHLAEPARALACPCRPAGCGEPEINVAGSACLQGTTTPKAAFLSENHVVHHQLVTPGANCPILNTVAATAQTIFPDCIMLELLPQSHAVCSPAGNGESNCPQAASGDYLRPALALSRITPPHVRLASPGVVPRHTRMIALSISG